MNPAPPAAASLLNRRDLREIAGVTLALWAVVYAVFMLPSEAAGKWELWRFVMNVKITAFGPFISAAFLTVMMTTRRWPLGRRVALVAVMVLAGAAAHSAIDARIMVDDRALHMPGDHAWSFSSLFYEGILIYTWLYALYGAAVGLMLSRHAAQVRERQLGEAQAAAHQAQLAALRFQLNPHFLFNTLNAISSLIVTGRNADAESMTGKLSDFLRSSLASDPQSVITLADELAAVRAYLDIETVRFGERMAVEVTCPKALLDALAPSFVLQPLVENAVKYAVAPARRRVKISVEASVRQSDLMLIVEDDGEGLKAGGPAPAGVGVGLENVRRRLDVLYGERGSLEVGRLPGGGFRAAVRLPLERARATGTPDLRSVA